MKRVDFTGKMFHCNLKRLVVVALLCHFSAHVLADEAEVTTPTDKMATRLVFAKNLIHTGELQKAIRALNYLVESASGPVRQDAMELLAVALEENKRPAKAKSTYENYLVEYTQGEEAERVRQRLANLLENQLNAKAPLNKPLTLRSKKQQSQLYGAFMQYYYRGDNNYGTGKNQLDQSLLYTQVSGNWRRRHLGTEAKGVFSGRFANNFRKEQNGPVDIKNAYFSYKSNRLGANAKVGRQRGGNFGIGGRFDGMAGGYALTPKVSLNSVFGFPVKYYEKDKINTDEQLYGGSVGYVAAANKLEMDAYYLHQRQLGFNNRVALGSNLRWFEKNYNIYSSIDYDLLYNTHNLILLQAEYQLGQFNIFVNADDRKNPFIETSNALMSLSDAEDLEELSRTYSTGEMEKLASQLTGSSRSFRVGVRYRYDRHLSITNDYNLSSYIYRYMDLDNEIQSNDEDSSSFNSRIVAQRYTQFQEANILNFRYATTSRYASSLLNLSSRWRINKSWNMSFKYRTILRFMKSGERQTQMSPVFSLHAHLGKRVELEFEMGREWIWYDESAINEDYQRNFLHLGYVFQF